MSHFMAVLVDFLGTLDKISTGGMIYGVMLILIGIGLAIGFAFWVLEEFITP